MCALKDLKRQKQLEKLNARLISLGFDTATLSKLVGDGTIAPVWQSNDSIRDWGEFYLKNEYQTNDLIFHTMEAGDSFSNLVFYSDSLVGFSDKEKELTSYRREFGINVQLLYKRGPYCLRFVSSEVGRKAWLLIKSHADDLLDLCNNYFAEVLSLGPKAVSNRETECLHWAAVGKTAWETGEILFITERTVTKHLTNAAIKLGAVNKSHAIALAVSFQIINPLSPTPILELPER